MTKPLALQLYSVRREMGDDFAGTIRRVAQIGYAGIEMVALPEGTTPEAAKALFDDLGLTVCAAHVPLPLGDQQQRTLDTLAALGTRRMVCAYVPPDEYKTRDGIMAVCERLNEAAAVAATNGLELAVHNHWWEFEPVDGTRPYHLWLAHLDPSILFEVDTYWIQVGGVDPVQALEEFGDRARLLHVKDGPADLPQSDMVAVGQGVLDYTAIIQAAKAVEWLVVELDRCATDMMTAVAESYDFLTSKGLGHGRH